MYYSAELPAGLEHCELGLILGPSSGNQIDLVGLFDHVVISKLSNPKRDIWRAFTPNQSWYYEWQLKKVDLQMEETLPPSVAAKLLQVQTFRILDLEPYDLVVSMDDFNYVYHDTKPFAEGAGIGTAATVAGAVTQMPQPLAPTFTQGQQVKVKVRDSAGNLTEVSATVVGIAGQNVDIMLPDGTVKTYRATMVQP